tara:strand:- start:1445 stop:1951 length:507 start_codon:yes stop_codon:yes gene_type:complete
MTKLKTVNIKGKEYVEVNERLKFFRTNYKNWCLTSDVVELTDDRCVIKATIFDDNGNIRATGHAYEKEGSSFINKTSFVENCETSAWGRALANLGIGLDTSVASYEEVANAINQQTDAPKAKPKLDEDKFNNMLKAIEAGKGDAVKAKMPNYDIEDYQMNLLKQKLNG